MNVIIQFGIVCLNLVFWLLKLLPVQKKITYISRQMDTTPLDFQMTMDCVKKKEPSYKQVVLAATLPKGIIGKIRYCFHMFRQMYHIATSKAVVLDTYCIPVSVLKQRKGLVVIQMWHALGAFKKFAYSILDQKEGSSSRMASLMKMHENYTYVLASSSYAATFFAEAFRVPEEMVKVYPLPKTDMLLDDALCEKTREQIYEQYPRLKGSEKKVIVYAPTFRKIDPDALKEATKKFIDAIDFEKYEFILKTHPLTEFVIGDERIIEDTKFTSLECYHVADVIVTDYSATLFEAVLLEKPVYFYAFDYASYMENRSFYLNYEKDMPGPVVEDARELVKIIEKEEADYVKIKAFRERMVASCKKSYTEDFADFLLNTVK